MADYTKKITGAEIVVKELIRQGVDTIFGYPGGYVISIYDELYKHSGKIKHILTAHEQGAAFAADAYARVSGEVGVVLATGGPGATNLVTGIANAYLDSVPVVFITGNVAVPMLGQDSFQDIDIVGVTLPIVKHSYVVKDVKDLQRTICEAFTIAGSGRKGPVHIDIPRCIQLDKYEFESELNVNTSLKNRSINPSLLDDAARLIEKSKRPYIFCGGGVCAERAGHAAMLLSEKIGAPVGMTMMGLGAVPGSFALNLGMCGLYGKNASVTARSEADLIIALGVRFSDRATGNVSAYSDDTAVIHMDIDAAELGKNIKADISICGDLNVLLPALLGKVKHRSNEYWQERLKELKIENNADTSDVFSPRKIINCIREYYDDDTIVTTDVGRHQMWTAQYYRFEKPRKFISSGGLGAMGYGLGAAIGASLAKRRSTVILFTGDGSFGMNLAELATAVTQKLPITIVLFNNGTLGMVRQMQAEFHNKRYSNTTLERKTDFPALAKAFGAAGYSAQNLDELQNALKDAPNDAPCLIECKIDIDECC